MENWLFGTTLFCVAFLPSKFLLQISASWLAVWAISSLSVFLIVQWKEFQASWPVCNGGNLSITGIQKLHRSFIWGFMTLCFFWLCLWASVHSSHCSASVLSPYWDFGHVSASLHTMLPLDLHSLYFVVTSQKRCCSFFFFPLFIQYYSPSAFQMIHPWVNVPKFPNKIPCLSFFRVIDLYLFV